MLIIIFRVFFATSGFFFIPSGPTGNFLPTEIFRAKPPYTENSLRKICTKFPLEVGQRMQGSFGLIINAPLPFTTQIKISVTTDSIEKIFSNNYIIETISVS